jgi:hypothetical protein
MAISYINDHRIKCSLFSSIVGKKRYRKCHVPTDLRRADPLPDVASFPSTSFTTISLFRARGTQLQTTMLVTNNSADVSIQRQKYSGAIGSSVPTVLIDDIVAFSQDAKLPQHYSDYAQEVWYEMPVKDGLAEKVRNIANTWSEVGVRGAISYGCLVDISGRTKRISDERQITSADLLLWPVDHW